MVFQVAREFILPGFFIASQVYVFFIIDHKSYVVLKAW